MARVGGWTKPTSKWPVIGSTFGANTAAIESIKADACVDILMCQCKYLNNIVEQNHRAIKQITRSMLGFKLFWSARIIIAAIETMHRIRKGQMDYPRSNHVRSATVL